MAISNISGVLLLVTTSSLLVLLSVRTAVDTSGANVVNAAILQRYHTLVKPGKGRVRFH